MLWCDARILAFFYTFFFFNDTATTEIYTLSLHDALPISRNYLIELAKRTERLKLTNVIFALGEPHDPRLPASSLDADRKSTRLNSSHANISYAVFCLKKKKTNATPPA